MLRVWPPLRFQLKCFKGEVFSRWQTHSMTASRDHLRSPQKLNNLLYCIWFGRKTTFGSEMLFASKEQWTYHYVVRYHQLKSRGHVRSNELNSSPKNGEKGNLNVPYGYCTFYKCFVFAFCQLLAERLNTEKDRNGDELKLSDQLENGRIYLLLYKCLKISLKCLYWLKYRPEVYRKWFWLNIFLLSGLCDPNHRIFQTSSS